MKSVSTWSRTRPREFPIAPFVRLGSIVACPSSCPSGSASKRFASPVRGRVRALSPRRHVHAKDVRLALRPPPRVSVSLHYASLFDGAPETIANKPKCSEVPSPSRPSSVSLMRCQIRALALAPGLASQRRATSIRRLSRGLAQSNSRCGESVDGLRAIVWRRRCMPVPPVLVVTG